MHSDKEEGHTDVRRRDDSERKHRGGESIERRHRDPEKESRRDKDKYRESTRERRDEDGKSRYTERGKEGSRDRRGDKERERDKDTEKRRERERVVDGNRYSDDYKEIRDQRRHRDDRERDKERHGDRERDRTKDQERYDEEYREKRREEREKERRREEHHREHRIERERKRHEESGEGGRDQIEKYDREQRERHRDRERHKDEYEDKRTDKDRGDRHGDRRHSERKEERENRGEHRRHKEERDRRHKERGYRDETRDSESREHRDLKRSAAEKKYDRGDGEQTEWDRHKERRYRGEEEDPEKKHRERKHREDNLEKKYKERSQRGEGDDPDNKYKERKHRGGDDPDKKYKERKHRGGEDDPETKHKERSHREDKDLERNDGGGTSLKKSASDKSHRHETKTEEVEITSEHWTANVKDVGDTEPVVTNEDLADQEYEDDFEDYEEDFEEMDQSEDEGEDEKEQKFPEMEEEREELVSQKRREIEAIQRAMNEENERVGTTQSRQSTSREEEDTPKRSRGSEKNQSRASSRGRFIDFMAAKQREAYVQCNEDNADRDIQTEEIELCEKWTQHPPEHDGACGDPNLSQEAREKNMNEVNFDSQRLTTFLRSATQVMVVLLEEVHAERNSLRKLRTQADTLSFSDGSLQLNTKLPFLYGRHISLVHFSQVQRHTMMSVHTPTTKPSAVRLDSYTIICIWNIWEPSRPQKILVYESEVQCCCFSPGKAILVFAGTSVGSVVLWDLREHAANHNRLKIGEDEWTFRQPTFSTDAIMAGSGHFSSVTSIEVVPSTVAAGLRPEVPLLASEEESSGLSFQLASLDESGVLNFWVVVELPKASEAGSPTDLGLRPGGKVKLLHSSSLLTAERVSPRDAVKLGPLQTLHLKFLPTDSNHFFIGTNMGLVSHGTSHGLKAPPKYYRFQEAGAQPVDVNLIHFSPFRQNFFLVGCADGSIRLHSVSHEQPVAEWRNSTAGESVVSLQWTQTRPTVFCVLDAASNLHIWDLMKNDTEPVVTERMSADRVTAMAVFGDSGQQNTYSGIALVYETGKIEMHYFTRNFTNLVEDVGPRTGEQDNSSALPQSCPNTVVSRKGDTIQGNAWKAEFVQAGCKANYWQGDTVSGQKHEFTHGLHCIQHFPCDSPVRFMMYSEAAATFISLHSDNTVCRYTADGHKQTLSVHLSFTGLTDTKISGCLVGWGPGPVFTLLDHELRPLDAATGALDICVCQPAEHSTELVTAGVGNVCVWSVRLMRCKVKIQEGMHNSIFTHMALAPPGHGKPHRAFAVCGNVVTVVDLDAGKVLEHRQDLCTCNITAVVYCSHLDCLITASEKTIRVWESNWEKRVSFIGHNGKVNSLFYCSGLRMLLSASEDHTIRCWSMEEDGIIECVHAEPKTPLLCVGGSRKGDAFFSLSQQAVDFWSIRNLYNFHCKLKVEGAPLRQVLVSPCPAPYPIRVLCLSGDSDVTLVTADTGAVLTSFKAKQRILCADYCLHKEILLTLTEAGTLIQANTLTNPITLIQEWKGKGQGPWHQHHVTGTDAQNLPIPGLACCLVIYSYVAETKRALEEWRNLQERRGCSHRSKASLNDAKNRFLIILGQNGGCVSVLTLDNGKVLYSTSAHDGQKVTALQVYPEHGCLLSTGEDLTVVVWRVHPYAQDCLSQLMSLHCNQAQVYLAALGPQLALTFQEPNSGTYSLIHFNLLNQSWTSQPPTEGHLDHFTGLCVCPDLDVFVSSSLDGTLHIWDEKNHLIRTLQLNAVPECLAYGGFGGELFLGIKGNLYKINCAKFLPQEYQQMLLYTYCAERLPDSPIIVDKEKHMKKKTATSAKNMEEESIAVATNQSVTSDMWRQKEYERLLTSNTDLSDLLQGTVKSRKEKPPSTAQTKKEAFDRYMKIIYGLPYNIKIDFDDFDDTFSFRPKPKFNKPYTRPPVKESVDPEPELIIPVIVKKKKVKKASTAPSPKPSTPVKVKPQFAERVTPKTPIIVEKEEEPPKIIPPIERPKPKPPAPRPAPRPLPPRTPEIRPPSPEMPSFLNQFADADWFKDLFPDKKSIPSTLSPEQFSLQLLGYLHTCSTQSKMKVLGALQALHRQGLFGNKDKLYHGLLDLVPKFARHPMSALERSVLVEMMNLLMRLKTASYELVTKLLTLLAFKKLALRDTVLGMLNTLGVDEAEKWLWPELKSWDKELQDQSDIWKSLHDRADSWLDLWISKYKDYNRYLYLKSTETWKPPSFSVVDVLNYFCFDQEEQRKARAAPVGQNNTVLLPLYDWYVEANSSEPIIRLGETYSMARIRRPPGITLPPLRNRPFLTHIPSLITFPISRVTLSPFCIYSEEDWHKILPRRYFIQEQSYIEYYR
ncbi:hypothetical protein INR49_014902 [Caranx melampygus]|nr:hypothetical protein INR49_014902 [Caranx melampygus]